MSALLGGGQKAAPYIPPPVAPVAPPTINSPIVAQAAQNERAKALSDSTIATSPLGLVKGPRTQRKSLLGE